MLTNIKLAMLDDNEIASGDISVLGVELSLFEPTYAVEYGSDYLATERTGPWPWSGWRYCCRSSGTAHCPTTYPPC